MSEIIIEGHKVPSLEAFGLLTWGSHFFSNLTINLTVESGLVTSKGQPHLVKDKDCLAKQGMVKGTAAEGEESFEGLQIQYEPGSKLLVLGMVIPPLIGNPYNGYINPYYWVDDHPLLYGNNVSLDPSTYEMNINLPNDQ